MCWPVSAEQLWVLARFWDVLLTGQGSGVKGMLREQQAPSCRHPGAAAVSRVINRIVPVGNERGRGWSPQAGIHKRD